MKTERNVMREYLDKITDHLARIEREEHENIRKAAEKLADQIAADRIIYVYGPGGHSNMASQEVFFRAGGLMHFSAILDEGTLLNNGALRSMAMERTPGYGRIVIDDHGLTDQDVLIIVNAYGINAATIDAGLTARERGARTIGVSSFKHASETAPDHPARHPTGHNLHEIVDLAIDSKLEIGDAVIGIEGVEQKVAAMSTFANAFVMNALVMETVLTLQQRGITPPIWRSGNAPGGDEWNRQFIANFKGRIRKL